jgi:signal transduction histidine kinase
VALLTALILTHIHGVGTAFHLTTLLLLAYGIWLVANEIGIRLSRRLHGVEVLMAQSLKTLGESTGIHELDRWVAAYNSVVGRLIQQAELVQAGRLGAQVAHDIRSPLAALNAAVGVESLNDDERKLIRSAVQRIRDISNDLLSKGASAPAPKGPRVCLLIAVIDRVLTEKRLQYKSSPRILIEGPGPESYGIFATVESDRLERALSNLIDNAVEACGGAGQVRLELEGTESLARILVTDTGRGIPPEVLRRLGQRGETWGKPGGLGLGLYSARQAAESWGGRLEIESEVGKGTRVWLGLPRSEAPEWYAETLEIPPGAQVAVLDDDPSVHAAWKTRLKSVQAFREPGDLEKWVRGVASPEGVFLLVDQDLGPGRPRGLEVLRRLAPIRGVLVTSGYDDPELQAACAQAGVRLLPKPLVAHVILKP